MDGVGDMDHGWRRRRHRTCVHRRARWRAPPRGTQRRTRHRRMTTVSSTSSFCSRRRRRRLLGRQAAGRGTTFGAGFAASAPSPPHHLQSTRAHSAPSVGRCTGTSRPDLGVRAQLHRSARASKARGERAARRSMASGSLGAASSSDPPGAGRSGAERAEQGDAWKKRWWHARIKGGVRAGTRRGCCARLFQGPQDKVFRTEGTHLRFIAMEGAVLSQRTVSLSLRPPPR